VVHPVSQHMPLTQLPLWQALAPLQALPFGCLVTQTFPDEQ
jgi:hypothetical protein